MLFRSIFCPFFPLPLCTHTSPRDHSPPPCPLSHVFSLVIDGHHQDGNCNNGDGCDVGPASCFHPLYLGTPPVLLRLPHYVVRLKLAFCTTCVVQVLVLAQGPSFLRLRRALLRRRGDSQVERRAMITLGKVKTIQTKCFTFTEEIQSGW